MFDLLFKIMKEKNFSYISGFLEDKYSSDQKIKKEFFNFYFSIKPLFGFYKINFNEKKLLSLFWKQINKLSFEKKIELIEKNPFITHFLNKNEFKKYILEKSKHNKNRWMFEATFNKEYEKLNIDISNRIFSLRWGGRFILNNQNIKIEFIKKFLSKIVVGDLYIDDIYFSWKEFILLIEKSELDVKKYLLDLAKQSDWIGCQTIINRLSTLNKDRFNQIKNDENFKKELYKICEKLLNNNHKILDFSISYKVENINIKTLKEYKKIKYIYELFSLPLEITKNSKTFSLIKEMSQDINYDTSQVGGIYFSSFNDKMNYFYRFYKLFLFQVSTKTKKISIVPKEGNKNLIKMNQLLIRWMKMQEKDIETSGFIALKFLKECILLLFPDKKEYFKKNSFYLATKEAAKTFENKIKWTTEILFAPTSYFQHQARYKICHFKNKDPIINYKIMCLAMEYFKKWLKKTKILNLNNLVIL